MCHCCVRIYLAPTSSLLIVYQRSLVSDPLFSNGYCVVVFFVVVAYQRLFMPWHESGPVEVSVICRNCYQKCELSTFAAELSADNPQAPDNRRRVKLEILSEAKRLKCMEHVQKTMNKRGTAGEGRRSSWAVWWCIRRIVFRWFRYWLTLAICPRENPVPHSSSSSQSSINISSTVQKLLLPTSFVLFSFVTLSLSLSLTFCLFSLFLIFFCSHFIFGLKENIFYFSYPFRNRFQPTVQSLSMSVTTVASTSEAVYVSMTTLCELQT